MGADCRELDGPLGPLECYRDFRQKYARATSQPFRRAAGVFATSTRATGARLKLCQAQAVGRFPAESYSLPIPSFPLQPLRPHNARTRARADATQLEILSFPLHPLRPHSPASGYFSATTAATPK